jgi:hypothetical protein
MLYLENKMYQCRNYRPNTNLIQMPGACLPNKGQIIADLYDGDNFYRSAVVAQVSKEEAQRYCDERNNNAQTSGTSK